MKARIIKEITGAAIKRIPVGTEFEVITFGADTSVVGGLQGLISIYNYEFEIIATPVSFFDLKDGEKFYKSIEDFKNKIAFTRISGRKYIQKDNRQRWEYLMEKVNKMATYNARRMMVFRA